MDHFARLGLPAALELDAAALDKAYFARQRQWHPDRFVGKPAEQRANASAEAAALNDAYRTLKDPLSRAVYLASLKGVELPGDGKTIDDRDRSSSDIQRCTDVALDKANVEFHFDNIESRPRLSVAAHPVAVALSAVESIPSPVVRFRMYTNYSSFIERSEIRILDEQQSLQGAPLEVIAVDAAGTLYTLDYAHLLGPGGRTEPVLSVWTPRNP